MRKSCVIYDSWAEFIIDLPPEMAGEFAQKLLKYAIKGEEVNFSDPGLKAMFASVKNRLDEDFAKYQAQVERAKTVSKRSRTKSNEVVTISERNRNDIAGVNVNVNVNDNDKKIKKKNAFHNFPERAINYEELKNV